MYLGGNMNRLFDEALVYEEFEGRMVIVQAHYDYDGVITELFVYSEFMHSLVKVDLEAFEQRHPTRYNYLQNRVNDALNNNYKEYL